MSFVPRTVRVSFGPSGWNSGFERERNASGAVVTVQKTETNRERETG